MFSYDGLRSKSYVVAMHVLLLPARKSLIKKGSLTPTGLFFKY